MIKSEQINELAAALAKAQSEFPVIPKNKKVDFQPKTGGRVKYNYADLADVISITAPILSKHGLSVSQDMNYVDKELFLETTIMHSSGQYKTGVYPVKMCDRAQEQGAEITYARRYTLSAALGIHSDEDTDGGAPNDLEGDDKNKKPNDKRPAIKQPSKNSFSPNPNAPFDAIKNDPNINKEFKNSFSAKPKIEAYPSEWDSES